MQSDFHAKSYFFSLQQAYGVGSLVTPEHTDVETEELDNLPKVTHSWGWTHSSSPPPPALCFTSVLDASSPTFDFEMFTCPQFIVKAAHGCLEASVNQ